MTRRPLLLFLCGFLSAPVVRGGEGLTLESPTISVGVDAATGLPARIETHRGSATRQWLSGPARLAVRSEVTSSKAALANAAEDSWQRRGESLTGSADLAGLPLKAVQQFSLRSNAVAWDIDFRGDSPRVAHEVTIELPVLSADSRVFTPTERGVMEIAAYPIFQGLPYGANGWDTGQSWVLPLVSVFDPGSDQALTIALPADANIPHLQFDWFDGKTLRITLGHRGMGGGRPSPVTLLLFAHAADYRAVLRAYSDAFPNFFRPPLPRGPFEGTFWYHHIHDHPAPDEMARQNVRYIWSSFWFTHLGEYLPEAREWEPYTYAKWWKLGQTMSDDRIRAFVRGMHELRIGTYAYFNVTEYGGAGGKTGGTAEAARILREEFANALIKDARGQDIPTWEGAMAMNPGRGYSLWPFLEEQVRRHLTRLPEIDGFVIDRLDWASLVDYAHDDGLTMIGERPAENLALPVGEAVRRVAELSHAADKRVFVNQFYRVEVLRDVDGVCHENDYLGALGYLIPLRSASAWHHRKPYQGDLLPFEAQLKQRLHWALFPQMIAHQFPISQQAPNPRAADFLELYTPLFDTLQGKEQVLLPHCADVTGANDANLFVNRSGHYVVPITSRTRFISRAGSARETVVVTLRVSDAGRLTWAHAISADGPSYAARVQTQKGEARITVEKHGTATMLIVGQGTEPSLANADAPRLAKLRESLLAEPTPAPQTTPQPQTAANLRTRFRLAGTHVGAPGPVTVLIDGTNAGRIAGNANRAVFEWTPASPLDKPPQVGLVTGDGGTWFVPERIELLAPRPDGGAQRLATWQTGMASGPESTAAWLRLPLAWSVVDLPAVTARFESRDAQSAGSWRKRFGSRAAWLPEIVAMDAPQNGFRLEVVSGTAYRWPAPPGPDPRIPEHPRGDGSQPTCWFANEHVSLRVSPPDAKPYRLTVYVLDFDRNGRAMDISLSDDFAALSTEPVDIKETATGVYLTWTVGGCVDVELKKKAGFNVVLSGVFVDATVEKAK